MFSIMHVSVEDVRKAQIKAIADFMGKAQSVPEGRGLYGKAYVNGNKCLKVSYGWQEDGYIAYLKAARPFMQSNKHLPKVFRVVHLFDDQRRMDCTLTYMEALSGYDGGQRSARYKLAKLISDLFYRRKFAATAAQEQVYLILLEVSKEYYLDMHAGNVMLRGTTWVVTDPFSSPIDTY